MVTPVTKEEQHLGGGLRNVLNFREVPIKTGSKQTAASLCYAVVKILQLYFQSCKKVFG